MPEDQVEYERENGNTWDNDKFRDSIITAVNRHDIPFGDLPSSIDLKSGTIGNICDRLLDATLKDKETPEYATYGKVTPEGKLLISQKFTRGEKSRVVIGRVFSRISDPSTPEHYWDEEYPALDIHTHGEYDLPPSPQDLLALFSPTEKSGSQAIIVVTPGERYLLVKSLSTPDLESENDRQNFLNNHMRRLTAATKTEELRYIDHFMKIGVRLSPDNLIKHINDVGIQKKIQMQVLEEVCRERDIALYVGRANNQYTRRK